MLSLAAIAAPARADRAVDARADQLLARMTLDEKIGMVNGTFGSAFLKTHPGDARNAAGHVAGVSRLGIPDLFESDASLGVANGGEMRKGDVATALPSGLATAASFDPDIAYAGGAMIGAEARAKGFNVLLAGGANLTRDPLNGRNFEYLSEDVLVTGMLAGAAIRGIQSNQIVSTIKHYALNAQESGRNVLDARLAEAPMRESDLLAFQIAIETGHPGSVMCGYNRVNGDHDCENAFLLNDVLKRDWGYDGWVMSDWGAVHSTAKAAINGLDQESGQELDKQPFFGAPLKAAVAGGSVPQARLDDMVRRIVRTMIAEGLVDHPTPATPQPIDYTAHADVAQRAAEAGIVLLRNERQLLPLAATARTILVVGAHADKGVLSGGGSSQVRSVGGLPVEEPLPGGGPLSAFIRISYHASSPLDAIRARAPGATVRYLDGSDVAATAAAARTADVVIVFAQQWRSEAFDIETLSLPDGQDKLIDALAAANPKTVVVLETGGAVAMPWLSKVGAVLEAWYPGQRGGPAIARVLFGDVNPGGRLPLTFPASMAQAPRPQIPGLDLVHQANAANAGKPIGDLTTVDITGGVPPFEVHYPEGADVGYRWYARNGAKPLFPFGFGLSYTRFAYRGLSATAGKVSFTVTNIGRVAGADVPQVYADVALDGGAALPRLIGFQRVMLQPGESKTVTVSIDPRLLSDYRDGKWVRTAGSFPIRLGHDAASSILSSRLVVQE
nr:glycoside hydrolase family 3 C-terminal domain-containing protein [Sphingomonas nostoxanthinifaciens]